MALARAEHCCHRRCMADISKSHCITVVNGMLDDVFHAALNAQPPFGALCLSWHCTRTELLQGHGSDWIASSGQSTKAPSNLVGVWKGEADSAILRQLSACCRRLPRLGRPRFASHRGRDALCKHACTRGMRLSVAHYIHVLPCWQSTRLLWVK